jgi:hypothetical protein
MISSAVLTAQLRVLTETLDDPGTDLSTILDVLVDDLSAAVPSFLGLQISLHLNGYPVVLTAIDPELALTAGSSLALPVDPPTDGQQGTAVFYARNPGAFVDLAADTQRVHSPGCRIVLDGDLPSTSDPPPHHPGITGLADQRVINRAVGVLITRGDSPAEARTELHRRAVDTRCSLPTIARRVVASTNAPPHRYLASDPGSRADRHP